MNSILIFVCAVLFYVRLERIDRALKILLHRTKRPKAMPAALIRFYIDGREVTDMANIKVTESKTASIAIKDIKGNIAPVDGLPVWSLTDPSLAVLTPSADGMSCGIAPVGPVGECSLEVNADADLGEGVVTIMGTLPLVFTPGEAVTVEVSIA